MDKYANYNELKQHEIEGEDYVVVLREDNARIAVIALHGGGIEPGTELILQTRLPAPNIPSMPLKG